MKFSIVTPSYNSARFIRETIHSVLSQHGEFNIEYFVIDNCSTDTTREIVEEFQTLLKTGEYPLDCNGVELHFISESDTGMYDAINKGFSNASGDIYAWINADDIYLPGAFATMVKVFSNYPDIHWAKGVTSYMTEESSIWRAGKCLLYAQDWIKSGIYGRDHYFIQQDSVFWRAWLWQHCGGIDTSFKRAGDYYLWVKLAELTPLVTVASWVSCFRRVECQLSRDLAAYRKEARIISPGDDNLSCKARLFFRFENRFIAFLRPYLYRLLLGRDDYSMVLIDSKGQLTKITGQYYDVLSYL